MISESMSDMDNPWHMLQANQGDAALALLRERFMRNPGPRTSIALGAALLWVGEYAAAGEHFQVSLEKAKRLRMGSEEDYALLGTAEWCRGNYMAAIRHWQAGKTAPYAILGVCIHSPMLLFIASILRPKLPLNTSAILDELTAKLADPRTKLWPGTLGQFVAGLTSIEAVQSSWIGTREQNEKGIFLNCRWITDFYRELLHFHEGRITLQRFKEAMVSLADPVSCATWDEDAFVHLLRFPEFYIGRHESCA